MTVADGTAARCQGSFDHSPGTTLSPYFPASPYSVRLDEFSQVGFGDEPSSPDRDAGQFSRLNELI
jgi:hypothetical protein